MKSQSTIDFYELLNAINYPVFVHDADFRLIYVNRAYIQLCGVSKTKVLGKKYYSVFPRKRAPLKGCLEALKKQKECREVLSVKNKLYYSRSFPVIRRGVYQYSVHLLEDITQRETFLAQLENEKRFSETVIENTVDAIFVHDRRGAFSFVNKQACISTGYSKKELLKKSVFDIEVGLTPYKLKKMWKSMSSTSVFRISGYHRRKGGNKFPVEVSARGVEINGEWCIVALVHDISHQKLLESQLRQKIESEVLVSDVSEILLNCESVADSIDFILNKIGQFFAVSRAHVYLYDKPSQYLFCAHEWVAKGVKTLPKTLRELDIVRDFSWLGRKLKSGESVCLSVSDPLPEGFKAKKKSLELADIKEITAIPMIEKGQLLGFLGFNQSCFDRFLTKDSEYLLRVIAQLLARALMREELQVIKDRYHQQVEETLKQSLMTVSKLSELKDPYTANHQWRVAKISKALCEEMQLGEAFTKGVYYGALLHDIGKMQVPSEILSRPGVLTKEEFSIIKQHPVFGGKVVEHIVSPWPIVDIVANHHERLDGSGYPRGLKGEEISMAVRIVMVADVYEAMTTHRPYRPKKTKKAALAELQSNRGKLYDKKVVDALTSLITKKKFRF